MAHVKDFGSMFSCPSLRCPVLILSQQDNGLIRFGGSQGIHQSPRISPLLGPELNRMFHPDGML
jgi:hypothetical protein